MVGIYIHIPFCVKKCRYCDFVSFDNKKDMIDLYTERLISEIKNSEIADGTKCNSIFIGGGTPTSIGAPRLVSILRAVHGKFKLCRPEITVEVNPKTAVYDDFLLLKSAGVNRLSIGLQSANGDELAFLGRVHNFKDFEHTYNEALRAGFDNINIDLMFGLHEQTPDKWSASLSAVASLEPKHISCYALSVEPGTPLSKMELKFPDENVDSEMYYYAKDFLEGQGYKHYEISNFSKRGYECNHNLKYWRREEYIGFGAAAHSLINNLRYANPNDIGEYMSAQKPKKEILSADDIRSEKIFLGLRLADGIEVDDIFLEEKQAALRKLQSLGVIILENHKITMARKGLYIQNQILAELI